MWYALSALSLLLITVTYFCLKFALILIRVQDSIEESLDVIDEKYQKISVILERPLFLDSPEVKQVLDDIEETRIALHRIAYSLSSNINQEND